MNDPKKAQLDQRLRSLSPFEKEIQNLGQRDIKLRFSKEAKTENWVINNEMLIPKENEVAIHKHDRYISFGEHNHDYLEMMFVYSGEITHCIDGESILLKKGDILIMDMQVSHSISEASNDDIGINILMKREFFDAFFMNQLAHGDKMASFVVNAIYGDGSERRYMVFRTGENEKIWTIITDLLIEFYEQCKGMETAIRAYMLLLFNELIRNYEVYLDENIVKEVENSIAIDLISYIDANYKTLTLKEMSEVFNYNQDYLGKQIKKLTGYSMKQLVKKRKLKEAAKMLRNKELSVLEILQIVHYSNTSYFYKQFKEEFGMTPDEYRNKE